MRVLLGVAALAAFLIGAGEAKAQDRDPCKPGMVCASAPDTVIAAMERAGLKPKRTADDQGDPMLESDEAAFHFDVYFYGCEQHKNCDSLRFEVMFRQGSENTTVLVNKWNAQSRFLSTAVRPNGTLVASYDVATIGGLNERNFADVLDWWKSELEELGLFFQKELKLGESANDPKAH
ncbi:YbjN domain-containing protein [Sphingomonas sp.]|uniref:YbjN domain-containing protein n=1 Tax=Sphingomonas sp. TaxID=28214 RepID=UPI001B17BDAD|nr:YbjN domain-containing protein [Sphingomonas sp.]MBO9713818.1 YbjN domain-containing protein [Sphingomonas sp.]